MKKLKKGILVVFEGGECSGKGTIQKKCFEYFSSKYETVKMREPGSAPVSEGIRELLLNHPKMNISPMTELMLYEAARAQFVEDNLKPALQECKLVLCDRFYYSTIAYQGFGRAIDLKKIETLNSIAAQGIKPDIVFIFDVPYEEAMRRLKNSWKQKDRIEQEPKDFHEKVREGYLYIAKTCPEAVLIDATLNIKTIAKEIIGKIENYISKNNLD